MGFYYEKRMAGVPPLLALQTAQKAMLTDTTYPVHQWLGFTGYGAQ